MVLLLALVARMPSMGYAGEGGWHIEEHGSERCLKDCRRLVIIPLWKEGQGAVAAVTGRLVA